MQKATDHLRDAVNKLIALVPQDRSEVHPESSPGGRPRSFVVIGSIEPLMTHLFDALKGLHAVFPKGEGSANSEVDQQLDKVKKELDRVAWLKFSELSTSINDGSKK